MLHLLLLELELLLRGLLLVDGEDLRDCLGQPGVDALDERQEGLDLTLQVGPEVLVQVEDDAQADDRVLLCTQRGEAARGGAG